MRLMDGWLVYYESTVMILWMIVIQKLQKRCEYRSDMEKKNYVENIWTEIMHSV